MAPSKNKFSPKASLPFKTDNKERRKALHVKQKKARDSIKRDERFRRRREEDKNPSLRQKRLKQNVPHTLDNKRVWDEVDGEDESGLGVSVDVEQVKRRRLDTSPFIAESKHKSRSTRASGEDGEQDDLDSMLGSSSEDEAENQPTEIANGAPSPAPRGSSPSGSTTSTKLDLNPEALAARFPTLFAAGPLPMPKVLITTSLNSTLHHEGELLTALFPNSNYVPRSSHRYGHKFSVREISSFASNRDYTALMILKEDQKKPTGLSVVHLPHGPTFHFSLTNWVDGKKLPGHGNPTNHYPELILNNFRTPLGLLTAHLFRSLFPPQPDLQGRQVVTLHNQRDYIFLRRHRYVFRDKRPTEKSVVGPDGQLVKGVEEIRTGLQELGPRFTMKLRRVDKSIGRAGSNGEVEWEWKGRAEKQRTKFQL